MVNELKSKEEDIAILSDGTGDFAEDIEDLNEEISILRSSSIAGARDRKSVV